MPKVTIWIRQEDEPAWNAIKDRPELIHTLLSARYNGMTLLEIANMITPGIIDLDYTSSPDAIYAESDRLDAETQAGYR